MHRRAFVKNMFGGILSLVGISAGGYYYARQIEPSMLHVNQESISSDAIPSSFNNFKIIQFSDTHIGFHYTLNQLKKLVKRINELNPDLVVFTGDLIDDPQHYIPNKQLIHILKSIKASYGKFWVYGNHDHGGSGTNVIRNVMEQSDFQLLKNDHAIIEIDKNQIVLAGVDDAIFGKPDLEKALHNVDSNMFTLLLAHEPDYADVTVRFPVNIQLSGHSHGGQVRFPFIGHLYTPKYAEKYIQGKYEFTDSNLTLYVNKGIGTTRLPFRFLCKPELHSYTLKSIQ